MGIRVFGALVGQLLLRTLDRARRIHLAMLCRGFDGEVRLLRPLKFTGMDLAYTLGWSGLFVLMRLFDIPQHVGTIIMELVR
jgi:cobalt/nickel transport system permease protein